MSTENHPDTTPARSGETIAQSVCLSWRDRHEDGEPITEIAAGVDWHRATVSRHTHGNCRHGGDAESPDDHHRTGANSADPAVVDAVVDAIKVCHERSFGDTSYVTPGAIAREHDIDATARDAGLALHELARESRDGVHVDVVNPDANRSRWATRVDADAGRVVDLLAEIHDDNRGGENGRVSIDECEDWRTRHADGDETAAGIADGASWCEDTVAAHLHDDCDHTAERYDVEWQYDDITEADIDEVTDALADRNARSAGDTIHLATRSLARAYDIQYRGGRVTGALKALANGAREGFVVERSNPDSKNARWVAWADEEVVFDE